MLEVEYTNQEPHGNDAQASSLISAAIEFEGDKKKRRAFVVVESS